MKIMMMIRGSNKNDTDNDDTSHNNNDADNNDV